MVSRHRPSSLGTHFGRARRMSSLRLGGELTRCFLFTLRLSYSGKAVHRVFASQGQEAFIEEHLEAFRVLGGTPVDKIRYDNLKSAVTRVLFGRGRTESDRRVAFRSHYGFDTFYCIPGVQGAHQKGGVDGEVGRFRRNHLVPMPDVAADGAPPGGPGPQARCAARRDRTGAGPCRRDVHRRAQRVLGAGPQERRGRRRHPGDVLSKTIARYGRVDLLCLDELGYMELDRRGAELLLQVLIEREETNSVAIVSNESFSGWTKTFTDPPLCAAVVDRLTFGANIIETGTTSYRLAHARAQRSASG